MVGEYIVVDDGFSNRMSGKISMINDEVFYNDGVIDGERICVAWLENYFIEDFKSMGELTRKNIEL